MKVDHIGYAVRDIRAAQKMLEILGFQFPEKTITDTARNVYISFGTSEAHGSAEDPSHGEYRVELIAPIGDAPSPVDRILKKVGATPYHICYSSDHFEEDLAALEESGYMTVVPPESAVAFGGRRVIFMFHRAVGLIEIVES